MADRKYVRILAKDLPDVIYRADSGNVYIARYRVLSADSRQASRWSQQYEVSTNILGTDIDITESTDLWDAKVNSGVLSFTWNVKNLFDNKKLFVNKFHIYIKFKDNAGNGDWLFLQETGTTSFSAIIPAGTHKTDVLVALPTYRGLDATISSVTDPVAQFPDSKIILAEDIS